MYFRAIKQAVISILENSGRFDLNSDVSWQQKNKPTHSLRMASTVEVEKCPRPQLTFAEKNFKKPDHGLVARKYNY